MRSGATRRTRIDSWARMSIRMPSEPSAINTVRTCVVCCRIRLGLDLVPSKHCLESSAGPVFRFPRSKAALAAGCLTLVFKQNRTDAYTVHTARLAWYRTSEPKRMTRLPAFAKCKSRLGHRFCTGHTTLQAFGHYKGQAF